MKLQKKPVRRVIYFVVTVGLILLMIGGGYWVYAAMTASDRKENDFRIGQVETKIDEVFNEDIDETLIGESVPKQVRIENTGTIKQFVRVMVLPEVRKVIAGDEPNEQVLSLKIGTDILLKDMATADWIDGGDGYYYYNKAIEPGTGKETSYLFKAVQLSDQLSNRYDGTTFKITLKVESINCAKFAYRDAWWQGSTPADGSPLKAVDNALQDKTEN
ncbi:hypothetical protein JZO70_21760 [Enterococcus sp. 669A]|uniref:Alternate signal-mediated exported protein, CPF_0494 family n=1 Tax=Candidatus Enterococcus moelleringii TaxID=2815325 RepID=A0ABS3LGN6_9ENTE|nr:TasA family protein [Enterococcus sp. 669A]MBO1308814.1 hypothetical protein [Enterococcus sp. 669A]